MKARNALEQACGLLAAKLDGDGDLVRTEADAQAELHAALLSVLLDPIAVDAEPGLLTYPHHSWPMSGSRSYREISAGPSRATPRSDLVIFEGERQRLAPKEGGAPARFVGPGAYLVEVKLDFNSGGRNGLPTGVARDIAKWSHVVEAGLAEGAASVVFTDDPEKWRKFEHEVVVVPVPLRQAGQSGDISADVARVAVSEVFHAVAAEHRRAPLSMLREKDFETRFVASLRSRLSPLGGVVRSQTALVCPRTSRRRPLDVLVLDRSGRALVALELKTSHSKTFKTLGRGQLDDEAEFLSGLLDAGLVHDAWVGVFRYGPKPLCDDCAEWRRRFPTLSLVYSES